MEEASHDDINTAFNNLSLDQSIIKEITNSENESRDSVLSTFRPLVLSAIDESLTFVTQLPKFITILILLFPRTPLHQLRNQNQICQL